jgi:oxygen-independent coproporphyrinogen III oxidase
MAVPLAILAVDQVSWPIPQAAYVHVPFCRHRCGYCNFSVLAGRDEDYAELFLQALAHELSLLHEPRPVETLFIGGGTPTHLAVPWLERLLELVCTWFPLLPGGEFSVEANPCDITSEKLDTLCRYGVNRLSLGVQSFQSQKLRTLERDHDGQTACRAVELVAQSIPNVSLDLIFAAPGESLAHWQADLQQASRLPITHFSTYCLTFEKGTRFWNQLQQQPHVQADEETELAMYLAAIEHAVAGGFTHYEISNFARPGFQCRHNQFYWEGLGWYAAGPGAARFVAGRREVNHRSPTTYIRRMLRHESPVIESDLLSRQTWARERLAFGLRQLAGIDIGFIAEQTGWNVDEHCGPLLASFVAEGWLTRVENRVKLTPAGVLLSDSILAQLLKE